MEVFAPRDLDRAPREFDAEGHQVQTTPALQPHTEAPRTAATSRHETARSYATSRQEAARAAVISRTETERHRGRALTSHPPHTASSRPHASPPPSKAGAVRTERAHAVHTAPWAASAAFESWKQQRNAKQATGTVEQRNVTPSHGTAPTSAQRIEQARRANVPSTHIQALEGRQHQHKTGMRAAQNFAAWKQDQAAPTPAPATAKNPLPDDRVLRRAIRSREALLPEPARQYALLSVEESAEETTANKEAYDGAPSPQTKDAKSAEHHAVNETSSAATHSNKAAHTSTQSATRKIQMQQMATAVQTPAERLMWVSAHRAELASEHIVSSLYALEGTGLRAAHEARRLRMLAEALIALGKDEACLEALEALQKVVPHDAWVLLRLAEVCAKNADTLQEALRWCDTLTRLHPWLSQAQTLRRAIEAKITALH